MLWTAALDDRVASGLITSRIGLQSHAHKFSPDTDMFAAIAIENIARDLACVMIDEAQFLSHAQVLELARVVDDAKIPVLCYGLRTDFQAKLFPGSAALLGLADNLIEIKAVCHCGRKSSMNLRVDAEGKAVKEGAQTEVGGNDRYDALCRKHFMEATQA